MQRSKSQGSADANKARTSPSAVPVTLERLLRQRFHGAANVRGIGFQLLCLALRTFDLYREKDAPDSVLGEGLEDVDLRSLQSGNTYLQVKYLGRPFDWGKMAGVIASFREVLEADPTAHFVLVTNVSFAGEAASLYQYLANRGSTGMPSLPSRVSERLEQALQPPLNTSSSAAPKEEFLKRFRIERLTAEDLMGRLYAAIVLHFGVSSGNEELYAAALLSELARRSGNRITVSRNDLEQVRLRVEEHIERGPVNPAVRDGFVVPLRFTSEEERQPPAPSPNPAGIRRSTDDYFEGRAARPGHIAASVDVPRPALLGQIGEALERVAVCAVVASSGQGKSTLAYRYAGDSYPPEATFTVKACRRDRK